MHELFCSSVKTSAFAGKETGTHLSSIRSRISTRCGWYVLQPNRFRLNDPGLKTRQRSYTSLYGSNESANTSCRPTVCLQVNRGFFAGTEVFHAAVLTVVGIGYRRRAWS